MVHLLSSSIIYIWTEIQIQFTKVSKKLDFLKPSLVVGNTKMWYNKTEVATKTELENVKGMIEVSARLIKTILGQNTSSMQVPSCDYIIVRYSEYLNNDSGPADIITSDRYITPGGDADLVIIGSDRKLTHSVISLSSAYVLTSDISNPAPLYSSTIECYKYQ